MPAEKVRADYDALKNLVQSFKQQADATAQSLQSLKGRMDTLQGGDWVGQGASAFYAEMNDQVLPTIRRLHSALQTSADITQQISQHMKTAEDEAARVLRGTGAGAAGVLGASAAGGLAGAVGAAGMGAVGAAAGAAANAAKAAAAKAAADAARAKKVQEFIDKGDKDGAIAEAIKQYHIDTSTAAAGTPKYDASTAGEGATSKDGTVKIGDDAFSSPGWLASSVGHEMLHTRQAADRWYTDAQGTAINEIEAYDWEIQHAPDNNLTNAEVAELKKRRASYYNDLNDDNKKIVDGGSYKLPAPKAP